MIGLAILCTYLAATEPIFLSWTNWQNIVRAQAVVFVLAIGTTLVVLTGGIDLSIASMTAASAMILGLSIEGGWGWVAAVAATVGFGFFLGALNGAMIGFARIPFFVVTLGTLSMYQSFALLTKSGETVSLFDFRSFDPVQNLANGNVGPVPTVFLIIAGLYLAGAFVLRYTAFGRAVYAVGSNPEAARLTGINVVLVLVSVYAISGLTAGLAAMIQAGRLTAASPVADPNLMLAVIAAVLIGGTSFKGGDGGLLGTVVGVLFLGVISNGLSLADVSTFWQGMVSGGILIAAVGLGVLRDHGWMAGVRRRRRS